MNSALQIPGNQTVQQIFDTLTQRGSRQSQLHDSELHAYLTNLLVESVHTENVFRLGTKCYGPMDYITEVFRKLEDSPDTERRALYQHTGDYILFVLGVFPESLMRSVSPRTYAELGRRSYLMTAKLERRQSVGVFRKLFEEFQNCVSTLNWVRDYVRDPFYQYVFRQFNIV
jgi:hypothetical protein